MKPLRKKLLKSLLTLGLIFQLDVTTPLPNEESLRSIQEAEDFLNSNKPGYTDIEKLFKELDA